MSKAELKEAIERLEKWSTSLRQIGEECRAIDLELIIAAARSTIEPEVCRDCPNCEMPLSPNGGCYYPECDKPKPPEIPTVEFGAAEEKISLYPKIAEALADLPDNGSIYVPLEIVSTTTVGRLGATVNERASRDYAHAAALDMAERRILRIEAALRNAKIDVDALELPE